MSRTGRPLALLGALALLVSAFLPWTGSGRTGIDLGLLTLGDRLAQPTVGLTLVALAALPAVAALLDDHGWPRGVAALASGSLVVAWLARGPDGALTSGVAWAMAATATLLVAAAVASPRARATARYPDVAEWSEATGPAALRSARTAGPAAASALGGQAPAGDRPTGAPPGDVGSRVVPFTSDPVVEAWGPTRSACFGEAVLAMTGTVVDLSGLEGSGQVAVRMSTEDDARTLLALADQATALLRSGRVPVGADLFDTDTGTLVGYLAVADLPAAASVSVPDAVRAEVEADDTWRAQLTLR